MIISFRRMIEYVKLLVLFVCCTLIFYSFISLITDVIMPTNPYKKPDGNAVKVFSTSYAEENGLEWYKERLKLFYRVGE